MSPMSRQKKKLREAIANAREEAALSQKELSLRVSNSRTLMQKIEAGTRDIRVTEFVTIANAMGIDPIELLRRSLQ